MRLASITRVWDEPTVLHPSVFFFISLSLFLSHTRFGALGSFFSFFLTSFFSFFCFFSVLSFFCLSYTYIWVNMYIHICTYAYSHMHAHKGLHAVAMKYQNCSQKKCFQCSPKRKGLLDFGGREGRGLEGRKSHRWELFGILLEMSE